ncbi:MAG TPA: ABC transporter permease subunit [Planctomycetota bacterium]|nr:ABC transporter permease subunit [Planctomycetota bacterium]
MMVPKKIKWTEVRHHWEIYLFIVPTLFLIGLFQYYPAASGVFHSFFRWNGADISEYVGWDNYSDLFGSMAFWHSFKVAFILGAWNVFKMLPPLIVAVCIHRCRSEKIQFLYRCLFVVPMVIPGLIVAMIWRYFFFEPSNGYLNHFLYSSGIFDVLCSLDRVLHLGNVQHGVYQPLFAPEIAPNWLGHPKLILAACVLWGFPWVGSFAVLTHLAKLQNISKDVYEAADIDGVSWWSKFTRIEFPLIMSSIYLLLVFTIIDTIKDAAIILALADMDGGPGGAASVPALFMIRKAFKDNQMGYACAIGIVLTLVVMLLQKASTLFLHWEDMSSTRKSQLRAAGGLAGFALLASAQSPLLGAALFMLVMPYGKLRTILSGFRSSSSAGKAPRSSKAGTFVLRAAKHLTIWLVLTTAFLPVYLMLIVSLKTNQQFNEFPATLTAPYHFENWSKAWSIVGPSVANSIFLSISTTFLTLAFALGASYFFARQRMPFSGVLWNAVLVLMMMPAIANLMPLYGLLRDISLLNSLSALILVGAATGQVFSIFVLRNFISDLPQDLFEAAEIDGASHFQQLKTIVAPLSGTILGTIGVMLFIQQWNEFVLPLIVMRDQTRLPVMVAMQRMAGEYIPQYGPLMAGYAIVSVPIIILFIFSMKLFIKGMTEGAVKG